MKARRISFWVYLVVSLGALAGCRSESARSRCFEPIAPGVVVAPPSVDATARDQYGRGQAIGAAIVLLQSGSVVDSGFAADTLHLVTRYNGRSGTFAVRVSKPFYHDVSIANVVVGTDECGTARTVQLPVVLQLEPGAPPVRSVVVTGTGFLWAPKAQLQLAARVDADPGLSTTVLWRLADSSLATIDASGLITAKCVKSGGTERVTALAQADTSVQGTAQLAVAPATSCP